MVSVSEISEILTVTEFYGKVWGSYKLIKVNFKVEFEKKINKNKFKTTMQLHYTLKVN